jgi:micrococcal nuclease
MSSLFEQLLRRRALSFAVAMAGALMVVFAWPALTQADDLIYTARVSHVFDGDTLWVRPSDGGRTRKLRIEGIDAPEICQEGGVAARDALRQRLSGQTVTVHEHRRDTYGRPLVDVALGDEDIAAWMVRQGWAWSYRWHNDPGPFAPEEAVARSRKRGIFGDAAAEEPRDFRLRHGPCRRG